MFFSTALAILSLYCSSSKTKQRVSAQHSQYRAVEGFAVRLTESEFLEGAAACLGVEEEDNEEFKDDPATVDGKELPPDGIKGDRVDVCGEESSELAEDLLDTDTTASLSIGPELDQVGFLMLAECMGSRLGQLTVCQGVVSHVVCR